MNKFVETLLNDEFGFGADGKTLKIMRLERKIKKLQDKNVKLERSLWYKEKGASNERRTKER